MIDWLAMSAVGPRGGRDDVPLLATSTQTQTSALPHFLKTTSAVTGSGTSFAALSLGLFP